MSQKINVPKKWEEMLLKCFSLEGIYFIQFILKNPTGKREATDRITCRSLIENSALFLRVQSNFYVEN